MTIGMCHQFICFFCGSIEGDGGIHLILRTEGVRVIFSIDGRGGGIDKVSDWMFTGHFEKVQEAF